MGTFRIQVVNHRDADGLNLLLTASGTPRGLNDALPIGRSTPWADFASKGAAVSAEVLEGCRLYVGYGALPPSPDPNGTQYYGWIEFSKVDDKDGLWINLSSVDIVGLPLALNGNNRSGTPFSLGYRASTLDIVARLKREALTGPARDAALRCCSNGSEKVIAPNIQFNAYRSLQPYLDELVAARAPLVLHTDTPTPAPSKVFRGAFGDGDTIVRLTDGTDTFEVSKAQFSTEFLYRCDGGTVIFNGRPVAMNRPDRAGGAFIAEAVYTNSLFRGLCTGINEGYFSAHGPNDSTQFLGQKPFGDGKGNVYAKVLHESSNSYGYPYADGNLKTLVQADGSGTVTLTILKDDETGFYSAG